MAQEFIARRGIISLNDAQITGSLSATGNISSATLTVTSGITGTATSASYVEYSNVANKPALVSGSAQIVGYNVFATTGSNQFNGSQAITGSLTVTGQVVAQTLNVQQVTSSIVFSSGSNIFGNSLGNTQQFTGSVSVTGSLTVNGAGTFSSAVTSNSFISDGTANEGVIRIERDTVSTNTVIGALNFTNNNGATVYGRVRGGRNSAGDGYASLGTGVGDNLYAIEGGNVGIGTTNPSTLLHISGSSSSIGRIVSTFALSSGFSDVMQILNPNQTGGGLSFNIGKAESTKNLGKIAYVHSSNGSDSNRLAFGFYDADNLLNLTAGGNVGIGTTNPSQKLEVVGGEIKAGRVDSTNEGGQVSFGRASDNATGWYIDVYGNTSTPDLRFVDVSNSAVRMTITSGGVVRIANFTTNGLVGTDSSGNLRTVSSEYTEIATGTITYSMNSGAPWGINNSFPATIRNYEDDGMAGSAGVATSSNLGRGVTFDLGSAKAVRKIVERGYNTKNLNVIIAQYSTDNSNWTDIYVYNHVYGNTQKNMEFNPTGAISARYWRWFIHDWTEREVQNYYTYESIIYT
jgi:hypothetical protein